jgi:5'/3'-nucleotidase
VEALTPLGEVWVVAPESEQSAASHAISLHRPLRIREVRPRWYAVDGTPTDCSYVAINHIMKAARPGLMVSGINHGPNMADDVTYSGTVAAAMEGALLGFASMAVSQAQPGAEGFAGAAEVARLVAARVLVEGLPRQTLLNVNIPPAPSVGIRVTRLGRRVYREKAVREVDPRGRPYYWLGAGPPEWDEDEGSDIAAIRDGFATVTPVHLDLTNYSALRRMTEWEGGLNAFLKKRLR